MKFLWTEDTGAGLHFWKLVNKLFFDNGLVIESKESNQGILDALSDLEMKADDKYQITPVEVESVNLAVVYGRVQIYLKMQ